MTEKIFRGGNEADFQYLCFLNQDLVYKDICKHPKNNTEHQYYKKWPRQCLEDQKKKKNKKKTTTSIFLSTMIHIVL